MLCVICLGVIVLPLDILLLITVLIRGWNIISLVHNSSSLKKRKQAQKVHFEPKLSPFQVQRSPKYAIFKVAYPSPCVVCEGSWRLLSYFLKEINHSFRLKITIMCVCTFVHVQLWVYLCTYTPLHPLD